MLGMKNPRLSKILPASRVQKLDVRRNLRSNWRGREDIESGIRGLRKYTKGDARTNRVIAHARSIVLWPYLLRPPKNVNHVS